MHVAPTSNGAECRSPLALKLYFCSVLSSCVRVIFDIAFLLLSAHDMLASIQQPELFQYILPMILQVLAGRVIMHMLRTRNRTLLLTVQFKCAVRRLEPEPAHIAFLHVGDFLNFRDSSIYPS
ncbi:hypothetical protein PLICRDRAFT_217812 [Plicaturopsis crispa FD-325 SS-3]|nr:hypothetical protein PLICRDRAFT_217812 [Plicaturopsis crispa FD-325 SS-3]